MEAVIDCEMAISREKKIRGMKKRGRGRGDVGLVFFVIFPASNCSFQAHGVRTLPELAVRPLIGPSG